MSREPKLIDKLQSALSPQESALLAACLAAAGRLSVPAYLVGGPVRDLLLGRRPLDIDIAFEGDALAIAREAAAAAGARVAKTTAFGTATLKLGAAALDLVACRSETYPRPGALPKVRPATIDDDLRRRDFAINAMALALNGGAPGKLLDPTGGRSDLARGRVRVLHDASFRDDATRMLRAVRYEARFGFQIEERTLDLLRRDLAFLGTISGARIRRELARTLAEEQPERALLRMAGLHVLPAVHPALSFTRRQAAAFRRLRQMHAPLPAAYWPVLLWYAAGHAESIARRLSLPRSLADLLPAVRALADGGALTRRKNSDLARALDPYPKAAVWAAAALSPSPERRRALDYLTRLSAVRPVLRGDDVVALGVPRGPRVAQVLARLRAARLDGEAATRADEERLVRRWAAALS